MLRLDAPSNLILEKKLTREERNDQNQHYGQNALLESVKIAIKVVGSRNMASLTKF